MTGTLHFFTVPALSPLAAQGELNAFMQAHRIVNVEKQWVPDGAASFWALCVTTARPRQQSF
jgi:hypothetical protein